MQRSDPIWDQPVDPVRAEEVRRDCIVDATRIPDDASLEIERAATGSSQLHYLLIQITDAAKQFGLNNRVSEGRMRQLFIEGIGVVDKIQAALSKFESDDLTYWNFWQHDRAPLLSVKAETFPHIDRPSLESSVGDYLDLSYRAQPIDRLLVDLLVAAEVYAFGAHARFTRAGAGQAIGSYLIGQVLNVVVLGGIAAIAIWAHSHAVIGETATYWIVAICALVIVGSFAVGTIALPFALRNQIRAKRKTVELLNAMTGVYQQLDSHGPISAHHVQAAAREAAAIGVVWPSPLFALLDDIVARSGRF